ncbi:helix-turn-helix transcriptional regulator [Xanthomonas hortorum]|uniref:Helix-turn-helix transcriptional regulator n=1 Tax=Xanthomonas hortorum TaxID=56454 RepID=A0AA47ETK6_9XANT|nr:helix-turn-helix transcriptional regulator [Xanthomonas hortorum]WAH65001.1 helix-turn-helix transcriptional regulator [Xanthomonas hortorum]
MADATLSSYLRERRERLDPAALGYPGGRRRTPRLRREEVAQRANISATWYSWLEQGRGGAPSAGVLNRIAKALLLTDAEREHLFLLGLGRLPDVRYHPPAGVTPRLQRVLDAMETSPAFIRTVSWDVVAWNAAAAAVLTDYATLPSSERNVLRLMFLSPASRVMNLDWEGVARSLVTVFRADAARAGANAAIAPLVEELRSRSEDFARLWEAGEVNDPSDGIKHIRHPILGEMEMEYSSFAVEGRTDLILLVCNPVHQADAGSIRALTIGAAARG